MKLPNYIILLCLLISASVYSQTTPPNMIPPSPTAYSLGKYGDVPVSLYTGVPNISVPVYTLKDHDVTVDVSLSYNGSGIKVDEMASNAGLGWSLNAGGVITRVVRGAPESLLSNNAPYPGRADIKLYEEVSPPPSYTDYINDQQLYAAATGQLDTEPDEFYYNFGDKSGKFCFDKNGNAVLEKQDGLAIHWEYASNAEKFIIKDEKGATYEFDDYETTSSNGISTITAWYLNKITSITGHIITFDYGNVSTSTPYVRSYLEQYVEVLHGATTAAIITPVNSPIIGSGTSEIRLQQINSQNGTIKLTYQNTSRKDYAPNTGGYALDGIAIYDPNSSLLKQYKLSTAYFIANNDRKYDGTDTANYSFLNYRLRLDSVRVLSGMGNPIQPAYRFAYLGDDNVTTNDAYTLPYRLSAAQDHWGYYNQSNNVHLLPGKGDELIPIPVWYDKFAVTSEYPTNVSLSNGANRESDSAAMKAGMLSKIYYPTGGYTEFFFEPNTNNFGGLRIKEIIDHPVSGLSKETDYTYTAFNLDPDPHAHYFQAYSVFYSGADGSTSPSLALLNSFGVPTGPYGGSTKRYVKITAQPQAILGKGSSIGYNVVRVAQPGNGYTESIFDNSDTYPDYYNNDYIPENATLAHPLGGIFESEYIDNGSYPNPGGNLVSTPVSAFDWPYPEIYSNNWKRNTLTSRKTYKGDGIIVKTENFTYYRQLLSAIPGFKVKLLMGPTYEYLYAKYYTPNGWNKLQSESVTDYDQSGHNPITSTTQYYYDNITHQQPTRTIITRSDGNTEITNTTYPLDYTSGTAFIDAMQSAHLLDYPIEQVKYKSVGGSLKSPSGTVTYYQGANGLPDYVSTLKNTKDFDTNPFKFSNVATGVIPPAVTPGTFSPDGRYERRLNFNSYDTYGNVQSVSKVSGPKINYIWSYGGEYPIAQISNADYSTVITALGGQAAVDAFRDNVAPTDAQVNTFLTPLRNPSTLPNSLITTYTYDPLVGMTSMTDAKGEITMYEYDNFQRLMNIKDKDGNIVKHMEYHYQNQ